MKCRCAAEASRAPEAARLAVRAVLEEAEKKNKKNKGQSSLTGKGVQPLRGKSPVHSPVLLLPGGKFLPVLQWRPQVLTWVDT